METFFNNGFMIDLMTFHIPKVHEGLWGHGGVRNLGT